MRRRTALLAFVLAFVTFAAGVGIAARKYPAQPYDWSYVVMSTLASRKYNPEGGRWFAGALGMSMLALWPVARYLRDVPPLVDPARRSWPATALRIGIACGVAIGVERLAFLHLSDLVHNAHELLALGLFAGLYSGVLGLYAERMRCDRRALAGTLAVAAPLLAIGVTQLVLYFDQRDLGWVDQRWRALGVPVWLSFAFWQWLAVAVLWLGLGHLVWTAAPRKA